jgi:hypothetical protein
VRRRGGGDDAGGRSDEAGVEVDALEREPANDPQPGRVTDVDLGQDRARAAVLGQNRSAARKLDRNRAAGEHEQSVLVQEQLVLPAVRQVERVDEPRPAGAHVDRVELPARDGEEV